jgi:hypothetical protein
MESNPNPNPMAVMGPIALRLVSEVLSGRIASTEGGGGGDETLPHLVLSLVSDFLVRGVQTPREPPSALNTSSEVDLMSLTHVSRIRVMLGFLDLQECCVLTRPHSAPDRISGKKLYRFWSECRRDPCCGRDSLCSTTRRRPSHLREKLAEIVHHQEHPSSLEFCRAMLRGYKSVMSTYAVYGDRGYLEFLERELRMTRKEGQTTRTAYGVVVDH